MEHSVEFTTKDGTEYRLTYDNETGGGEQMHYLLHEDGVLKLECSHHALPGDLTEDEFKSSVVPLAFLNCLGRTLQELQVKAEAEASDDVFAAELAKLIRPHVALEQDQVEYVTTILDRGHSVELFVQIQQELQVEQFARQLAGADTKQGEDEDDFVRPAVRSSVWYNPPKWLPPTVFAALVTLGIAVYILTFGV